jgi:hypothetical protein
MRCSEEAFGKLQAGPESWPSFVDRSTLVISESINRQVERLRAGAKNMHMISVTNDAVEEIANCVDENSRFAMVESGGYPSKTKVELWQKDAFPLIHTQCISPRAYRRTTVRG